MILDRGHSWKLPLSIFMVVLVIVVFYFRSQTLCGLSDIKMCIMWTDQ